MKRLTSISTVLCYFLVTFLEKGAIVLCVLVSCGINEPVEATPEKSKCILCCETRSACGSVISSVPAPIKAIEVKSCQIFMDTSISFQMRCECNLTNPNLTATHEQHKIVNFGSDEIRSEKIYCFCDQSANLLADQSRPRGVNQIISTTILRL